MVIWTIGAKLELEESSEGGGERSEIPVLGVESCKRMGIVEAVEKIFWLDDPEAVLVVVVAADVR